MKRVLLASLLASACTPMPAELAGQDTDGSEPGRTLVLTTTDHATGALVTIDTQTREVRERALVSSDAIPVVLDDRAYVINRFGFDYVDIYDPAAGWERLNQIPIAIDGYPSTNPQDIAAGDDGLLFVALYGAPQVAVLDPSRQGVAGFVGAIDLSDFADADGITEAGLIMKGSDTLAVAMSRVDRTLGWAVVDEDLMVFIDPDTREVIDLNDSVAGVQGLTLPGSLSRQKRHLPDEPDVVYLLSTGILRVDLAARSVSWALPESRFDEAGIGERLQPQSFAIDHDANEVYVAAYDAAYTSVSVYRAPLDGSEPLETVISGLNAVERTLEFVDGELWFGTTSIGAEGLLRLGASGSIELGPVATGLPPYSIAAW